MFGCSEVFGFGVEEQSRSANPSTGLLERSCKLLESIQWDP